VPPTNYPKIGGNVKFWDWLEANETDELFFVRTAVVGVTSIVLLATGKLVLGFVFLGLCGLSFWLTVTLFRRERRRAPQLSAEQQRRERAAWVAALARVKNDAPRIDDRKPPDVGHGGA
jgi:hypothetical protein